MRVLVDDDVVLPDRSLPAVVARRAKGCEPVDEWGLDHDLASVLGSLLPLRLAVVVVGRELLPDGPAVLVHNRTPLGLERAAVVLGVGVASDRPVRFTGVPDVAPLLGLLRRVGGVSGHGADVRGLLHAGQLVAVGLRPVRPDGGRTGTLDRAAVLAATAEGAPLVPVAVHLATAWRRARVVLGEPVTTRRRGRARPVDEAAALVRTRIAELAASSVHVE